MTVYEYHTAIDEFLGRTLANTPLERLPCCGTCTNPHCCYEPAYADAREVQAMLDSLDDAQRHYVKLGATVWRKRFSASPLVREELPSAFAYRNLNLVCPFLFKGRCLAYAGRPYGCRIHLALGQPDDCAMPARVHQRYAEWKHPNLFDKAQGEFMASAAVSDMDHIGAILVRLLLGETSFTTGAHLRLAVTLA